LSSGISANSKGDITALTGVDAVCDDSPTRLSVPANRHVNAGEATNVPLKPSLVDEVQGIDPRFLARHSQYRDLCEMSQASVPESHNSALPEAGPRMARIIMFVVGLYRMRSTVSNVDVSRQKD